MSCILVYEQVSFSIHLIPCTVATGQNQFKAPIL